MFPNLSIATDNIYKFACLFGLAIILASIFSFVSVYNSSLDKKVSIAEKIMLLEAKESLSKYEESSLELNKKLLEVSGSNQKAAGIFISVVLGIGIYLSGYGAWEWTTKIQTRDDEIAKLQVEKLRAEINALKRQTRIRGSLRK
jgi:hypothetical protein